jgi:hypothetical protein
LKGKHIFSVQCNVTIVSIGVLHFGQVSPSGSFTARGEPSRFILMWVPHFDEKKICHAPVKWVASS